MKAASCLAPLSRSPVRHVLPESCSISSSPNIQLNATGVAETESTPENPTGPAAGLWWRLTGMTATGFYLSAMLHLLSLGVGSVLFAIYFESVFRDEVVDRSPLAASLADEVIRDDAAALELPVQVELTEGDAAAGLQQVYSNKIMAENAMNDAAVTDALLNSFGQADVGTESGKAAAEFLFRLPESGLAVTKGSFTAWTVPDNPEPGQVYLIIIEIRLPDDVSKYRIADLRGRVTGSDGYRQTLPWDPDARRAARWTTATEMVVIDRSDVVDVRGNKVQLAIQVPGAARMVRDEIQIESRRLREKQTLVLQFGS